MLIFRHIMFVICCSLFSAKNIEIISSLPYNVSSSINPNIGTDIISTGAAFDLATKYANEEYRNALNVSMKYLFNGSPPSCDDVSSQAVQKYADYYYRNKKPDTCYAIVMSACVEQAGIASLAKEFDWMLFHTTLVKDDFLQLNTGSPTGVAVGGTLSGYSTVVLEILAYYMWYHATILVEAAKIISPFYKDVGNLLLKDSRQSVLPFALELISMDSNSDKAIKTALDFAKQRSRVLILLTLGMTAVKILKLADQMGMVNGEYVFFNIHSLQSDSFGRISQFTYHTTDASFTAFRSLFFIAYHVGSELKELNKAISDRSNACCNVTYKDENQPLDSFVVETAYNLVELFATVVNESRQDETDQDCSGLSLAKRMSNRTFSLATGELYVSSKRARNLKIDIFGFNTSTMVMQSIGSYDWAKHHLVWDTMKAIDWPTTDNQPPPDIPVCGFSGREGLCAAKAVYLITIATIAAVFCSLLTLGIFLLARWCLFKSDQPAGNWWQLANEQLVVGSKWNHIRFSI